MKDEESDRIFKLIEDNRLAKYGGSRKRLARGYDIDSSGKVYGPNGEVQPKIRPGGAYMIRIFQYGKAKDYNLSTLMRDFFMEGPIAGMNVYRIDKGKGYEVSNLEYRPAGSTSALSEKSKIEKEGQDYADEIFERQWEKARRGGRLKPIPLAHVPCQAVIPQPFRKNKHS